MKKVKLRFKGIKRDGTEGKYMNRNVWQPIRGNGASFKVENSNTTDKRGLMFLQFTMIHTLNKMNERMNE